MTDTKLREATEATMARLQGHSREQLLDIAEAAAATARLLDMELPVKPGNPTHAALRAALDAAPEAVLPTDVDGADDHVSMDYVHGLRDAGALIKSMFGVDPEDAEHLSEQLNGVASEVEEGIRSRPAVAAPEADAEPRETEGDALDAAAAMFYGPMTNGTIADELLAWRAAGVAAGERTAPEADAAVELKEAARALDVANKEFMCDGHLGTAQVLGHAWVKFRDALYRPLPPPTRRSPEEIAREVWLGIASAQGADCVAQSGATCMWCVSCDKAKRKVIEDTIRADRGE